MDASFMSTGNRGIFNVHNSMEKDDFEDSQGCHNTSVNDYLDGQVTKRQEHRVNMSPRLSKYAASLDESTIFPN